MIQSFLLVAAGGALGAALRHLAVMAVGAPWGVLAINVAGSFAIGALHAAAPSRTLALFLMTGVLGGFTTFSAFSLDTLRLIEAGRALTAAVYVAGSVALSILACAGGMALVRRVLA